ncbi:hypothetical protein [Streptomyces lavendulocolor]|uniref:hypothetical protein n=1 Tax=Streptomyces lavendulocolor TaxID=67316 RepID=UPI0031D31F6E
MATDRLSGEQVAVVAAAGSLVAAVASWAATSRASDTAEVLAAIERGRWHAELTPDLQVSISPPSPGSNRYALQVVLVGPTALEGLDSVTITIRDDDVDRTPRTPPPPTAEDVARQIWGPLHFIPGIDGVRDPGRATPAFALEHGRTRRFDMRRTQPPFWWSNPGAAIQWNLEYIRNQHVHLWIECRAPG